MMVAGTARNAATGFAGAGATAGATAEGATAANVLNRVVGCVSIWLVLMPGASGSVRSTVAVARVVFVFVANVLICGDKSGATAGFASIDGVIDENCFGWGAGVDEIPDGGAAGVVGAVDVVAVAVTSGRGVVSVEVCAPPELLTTTPPATTEVVAVVPLGGSVSAPLDGVEPCADGVLAVLPAIVDGVGAVAVPVGESVSALPPEAVDPVDPAELVAPVLSVPTSPVAHATPGVATAIPTPSATANAPTRPTYIA
jgi:hypothetical protein